PAVGSKPQYRVIGPSAIALRSASRSVVCARRPRHWSSSMMSVTVMLSVVGRFGPALPCLSTVSAAGADSSITTSFLRLLLPLTPLANAISFLAIRDSLSRGKSAPYGSAWGPDRLRPVRRERPRHSCGLCPGHVRPPGLVPFHRYRACGGRPPGRRDGPERARRQRHHLRNVHRPGRGDRRDRPDRRAGR